MIDESSAPGTWAKLRDEAEARWKAEVVAMDDGPASVVAAKEALLEEGPELARHWIDAAPAVAASEAAQRSQFTEILQATWGPALDALDSYTTAVACFGDDFAATQPGDNRTVLTEVLLTLHAAACSTAREIGWLLAGGYPNGAEARARTLHEIGVTALVLAQQRSDPDLLERFMSHGAVSECAYWTWVERHPDAGAPTLPADEVAELTARVAGLTAKYGGQYKPAFGWAAHLCDQGGLAGLEELVNRKERRAFFKLASAHAIHVNTSILGRHYVQRSDGPERLSNATVHGLGRPAVLAIEWLWDMCDALLEAGERSDSFGVLIAYRAIRHLRNEALAAFAEVAQPE